jgi:hypothetical protein
MNIGNDGTWNDNGDASNGSGEAWNPSGRCLAAYK